VARTHAAISQSSIELFLGVGANGAIGGGIGHAGEHEARFDLIVVQEALVGLVHAASGDLASAGGASTGSAGVGQVDALLFSSVEDVLVVWHLNGLVQTLAFRNQSDLVGSHDLVNTCRGRRASLQNRTFVTQITSF